ncbi:MAG: GNAT family N-acetyltransferase, partial [Oscillospiraceae bacterium]|nr:GNAT family N-acetyltransferase [Oscillospiraceae bacterium]
YCVTDLVYCADGRERRVGYLYAVGVDERSRSLGLGSALSREAVRLGKEAGAELICTSPAEDSLFAWYEKTLGLRRTLRRRRIRLDSRPGISPEPLTPAEYGRRREALLAGRPHLRPGAQALDFQQDCLRLGGGGFFALGAGLAAACAEDGEALLAELLNASEEDAASLGASLGCARTTLLQPSETGERFLAAAEPLAPESVWSFLFE